MSETAYGTTNVIDATVAERVRASFVLEGANGPCTAGGADVLDKRGIVAVPDIWANAGGVTVSYFEWTQNLQQMRWSESRVDAELELRMVAAHEAIQEVSARHHCSMRTAAFVLAVERVKAAADLRGMGRSPTS